MSPDHRTGLTEPCRVVLLTPGGRGAIATVAVNGSHAVDLVERFLLLRGRATLRTAPARKVLVGNWRSESGEFEEVVVVRYDETRVEIHCHGGLTASEAIRSTLVNAGAVPHSSDDWLAMQVTDPIQRAAWEALGSARTERSAGILLDQWRGALAHTLGDVRAWLQAQPAAIESAASRVARLIQLGEVGLHLSHPWRVVLAGPPNVGKSSLINALLGYERSIVFDEPGTTRDVLTATTAFDGWSVELSDMAGDRESADAVEQEGTRRAWRQVQDADLVVIVVDACEAERPDVGRFQSAARMSLVVANKVDRCDPAVVFPDSWLPTSAVTGQGIDDLARAIARKLAPNPPAPGEAVPFTSSQLELLRQLQTAVASRDLVPAESTLSRLLANSL